MDLCRNLDHTFKLGSFIVYYIVHNFEEIYNGNSTTFGPNSLTTNNSIVKHGNTLKS